MKVKDFINQLKKCNQEKDILISSDEELNCLFSEYEIAFLTDEDKYCIYGLSGSEDES